MSEMTSIIKEIQEKVAQKRRDGLYPPGVEDQLDAEFLNVLSHGDLDRRDTLLHLKNLVLDQLAVVDHLAMMIVELESRLSAIENSLKSR